MSETRKNLVRPGPMALLLATLFAAGCAVEPIRGSDDGGAPDAAHEDAAVSGVPDASPVRADAGYGAKDLDDAGDTATSTPDVGEAACAPGVPGCTCVARPPAAGSCVHSYGGVYADGGCSGSYQCCDGAWESSTSACGACVCTDTTGLNGCAAPGSEEQVCFPQWDGTSQPIPTDVQDMMRGKSWHENLECPPFDVLALLRFPYFDFAGDVQRGELIVAATEANALLQVFQALYEAQFPFERIELVHNYGGDDDASMAANNTSAFNCRAVTGGTSLSSHSYGTAIDINPVQNPYVRDATVLPEAGRAYTDRNDVRPGMIVRPGIVVQAFANAGWEWGGDFGTLKDYQHFSADGR